MNFTKIYCISSTCDGKNIVMDGAGGNFGGRITLAKVRCPECGTTLMIIPMRKDMEYEITAKTKEEVMVEEEIAEAKAKSEADLKKTIEQIKKRTYEQ